MGNALPVQYAAIYNQSHERDHRCDYFGVVRHSRFLAPLFAQAPAQQQQPEFVKQGQQFLQFMREQRPEVRNKLLKERKLTPEIEKQLAAAIEFFQPQFKA